VAEERSLLDIAGGQRHPGAQGPRRVSVCLVGVGKLVTVCEQAAHILAGKGLDATVWDARVASPLDPP